MSKIDKYTIQFLILKYEKEIEEKTENMNFITKNQLTAKITQ